MTDHDRHRADEGSRSDRVPPHNLEAEEAALGAALLNVEALDTVIGDLEPADFYRPAHRFILDGMRQVRTVNGVVDPITVGEQLRQNGTLDDVGGIEKLAELQRMAPSISGVGSYTRIVHDAAQLRRLLFVGAEITDIAYGGGNEPGEAVAKARDLLEDLHVTAGADAVTSIDVADIAALLETDLEPEQGAYLTRSDGVSLFYEGKTHVLQAEPSSGKSWIALQACVEVLEMGGTAGYFDFEDTPAGILRRLRYLGAPEDALRERFFYARPLGKFGAAELLLIDRTLEEWNFDLFVIDGVGESLARNGMSEDKADDVLAWYDLLPRRIAEVGAAVVMIDHVSKDPEHRGRWARGSGAKLGAIDGAAYQLKVTKSFSRTSAGIVRLVIAKDRPGGVGAIGENAAIVNVEPSGGGERVIVKVEPYNAEMANTDPHMPTNVMTQLSRAIEEAKVPVTKTTAEHLVHAKKATIHQALARLTADGFIMEVKQGRAKVLKSVRPFRGQTWHTEPVPAPEDPVAEPLFEMPADELPDDWNSYRESMDYLANNDPEGPTP